jgi:superfamily II DNA or RNA helicase
LKFKKKCKLRPKQEEIVDAFMKNKDNGGGLISVGCGSGKTVMALYIACKLKVKTLVVVHAKFLQEQWIERIKMFCGKKTKIGILRQNKIEVDDYDIVIGSIQSIASRDYGRDIFKQFGFVIYDEAHHVSSKHFSKSLPQTGCQYTLALTATPYRIDGLIKVMYWYLGDCLYKQSLKDKINKHVCVKKFMYNSSHELFVEKKLWKAGKTLPNTTRMTGNLCSIDDRTDLLVDIINNIRQDKRRKILILTGLVDHMFEMKNRFDEKISEDVENGKLEEDDIITSVFYGGLKADERQEACENGDIIFATYHMAQEALDIPRLNTVILSTPKKDITQAVGRILRNILKQGDVRPLIVDFTDDLSVFKKHGEFRSKYYNLLKYNEDIHYAYNKEVCTYKEYMRNKGIKSESNEHIETNLSVIFDIGDVEDDDFVEDTDSSPNEEEIANITKGKSKGKDKTSFRGNVFKKVKKNT